MLSEYGPPFMEPDPVARLKAEFLNGYVTS